MEVEFLIGIDNAAGVHASEFFRFLIQCQYWLQLMINDPELLRTRTMKMYGFPKLFVNKEIEPSTSSLSPLKRKLSVDDKQQQHQRLSEEPIKRR